MAPFQLAPQAAGLIVVEGAITGDRRQGDRGKSLSGSHRVVAAAPPLQQNRRGIRGASAIVGARTAIHRPMPRPIPARIALGGGILGLALTVINQVSGMPAQGGMAPALERAGVLASLLAVVLMLVGLLWERIEPVPAERAALQGREGLELVEDLPAELRRELGWGTQMLLTATPAATVLVHWRGRVLVRRGLLAASAFQPGAICRRAQEQGRAISLVDLRLYPGREEFAGLLGGLPAVLVQPIGGEGLLVLGGWSARCFGRSDLAWVEGWARRLTDELAPVPGGAAPEPGPDPGDAARQTG